jgi:hypothetical protein
VPRGQALRLRKTWELSKAWYDDRLSHSFRGRTTEEVATILGRLGLRGAFCGHDLTTSVLGSRLPLSGLRLPSR